jgi:hypothetical protein
MDSINKPTLLITDSYNFLYNQVKRRAQTEKLVGKNEIKNDKLRGSKNDIKNGILYEFKGKKKFITGC